MKRVPPPVPIPQAPAPPPGLAADVVASGLPVHPEDRVRLFSSDQWEHFVQEWVDSLRDEYELVERCGGAGDMGRDVIATVKGGNGAWDNYRNPLTRGVLSGRAVSCQAALSSAVSNAFAMAPGGTSAREGCVLTPRCGRALFRGHVAA